MWGRLLNFEADQPYVADDNPSIVRTPLVIAMWEPMAQALGYPKRKLGFDDILKLARSNQGWGAYGHPEYGQFKLVHTNPDFSTSGLSAVVAEYYAATGKKEGLQAADIEKARAQVRDIERSIVHYGDTTLFIADQMRKSGLGYASAVAMEEATLVDFNQNRNGQPKLVAIYPAEGTFFSDNPYIALKAPWVSAQQAAGAAKFGEHLADNVDGSTAAKYGFRAADLKAKPQPPLTAANGVDPAQPKRVLGLPEPRVLAALKKAWRNDRKPANVLLVLDTSGSMTQENRLANAKQGLQAFLREVAPQDNIGLTIFSDRIQPLVDIAPARANRAKLRSIVSDLVADGGTAIYDATTAAVEQVGKLADTSRINAVVLLTDGEDTDSTRSADQVVRELAARATRASACASSRSPTRRARPARRRTSRGSPRRRAARRTSARRRTSSRSTAASARSSSGFVNSPDKPYSREQYAGALVANAVAKPFNVALGVATIAAATFATSAPFIVALFVGLVIYAIAAARTFFDDDEAQAVLARERDEHGRELAAGRVRTDLQTLAPDVRHHLLAARRCEAKIRDAIERAELPYTEVSAKSTRS